MYYYLYVVNHYLSYQVSIVLVLLYYYKLKAILKNNGMKKNIAKRLRHNEREAENFRDELGNIHTVII